ncbi:MAG: TlpA family protein disulfide reductase [Gammaproteobacteria bacterium]|nr:TlpA family protein disulfide reductase [Gammaproteobacteria bacterium]
MGWLVTLGFLACNMAQAAGIIGSRAPPLDGVDLNNTPVSLVSLHGHTVLVMFWASWCAPCRKEMPVAQAAYDRYRADGFTILAINVGEDYQTVIHFVQQYGLAFPVVLDPQGKIARSFNVTGLPTNYPIDSTGTIRERIIGNELTSNRLDAIVQALKTRQ